jgi:hypothetical protein
MRFLLGRRGAPEAPAPAPAPAREPRLCVVHLRSGERLRVETPPSRMQAVLDGARPGRVGLKEADGPWRWVALDQVRSVDPA